jgi:hypothetical protein
MGEAQRELDPLLARCDNFIEQREHRSMVSSGWSMSALPPEAGIRKLIADVR